MLERINKGLLIAAVSITPMMLAACGPDDGNNKFTTTTAKVVPAPAAPAHADYKALLLNDQ